MQRVVRILYWQWTFLFLAVFLLIEADFSPPGTATGQAVLLTDQTDQFAPPYDVFTDNKIIALSYRPLDEQRFSVAVSVAEADGMIYKNLYYYTNDGWQQTVLGSDWLSGSASKTITLEYADVTLVEGDDLYVGAWACKGVDGEWKCGCKASSDCGYWHVQGVDIESAMQGSCPDADGDFYGLTSSTDCVFQDLDCDDNDADVNPGVEEVAYNGVDDDCDGATPDNDIDRDGYLIADDCDDTDESTYPQAQETCGDGIDQDCDAADEPCEQCGEGSIPVTGCVCQGVDKYTGYCCDNLYQYAACGTPEVIFYDGFESGTANTWDYLNPNSRVNEDMPYAGQYGLDLIYMAGTGLKKDQYAATSLAEERHLFLRYYLHFEEDFIQAINGLQLHSLGTEDDWRVTLLVRRWQGDVARGRLSLIIDGSELMTGKVLSNGQWYCVEMELVADDVSDGVVRLWVDDTIAFDQGSLSFADGSRIDYLKQGGFYDGDFGTTPIHTYVDNVVVSRQRVGCS